MRRSERPARSARGAEEVLQFSTVIAGSSISPSALLLALVHEGKDEPMSAFGTLARSFIARSAKRRQWYATIGSFACTSRRRRGTA